MERPRLHVVAAVLGMASACRGGADEGTDDASTSTSTTAVEPDVDEPGPFDTTPPDFGPETCSERALPTACIQSCTYVAIGEVGEACGAEAPTGFLGFHPLLLECTCPWATPLGVADVDGDGVGDLIARCDFDALTVWFGGTGRPLDCPLRLSVVSDNYGGVVVVDLDGDGTRDLVLVGEETISVLRGLGGRRFAGQSLIEKPHTSPGTVVVARVDDDAVDDLVAVDASGWLAWLYFGDGAGGFTQGPSWVTPDFGCAAVQVVDLDADGHVDLLLDCRETLEAVSSTGDGFGAAAVLLPVEYVDGVQAAELDGDGIVDLLFAQHGDLLLARGTGAGSFATPVMVVSQTGVREFVFAEIDGDGAHDVVGEGFAGEGEGALRLLVGDGAGGFTPAGELVAPGYIYERAIGDFSGDGRADAAFTVLSDGPGWNGILVLESRP